MIFKKSYYYFIVSHAVIGTSIKFLLTQAYCPQKFPSPVLRILDSHIRGIRFETNQIQCRCVLILYLWQSQSLWIRVYQVPTMVQNPALRTFLPQKWICWLSPGRQVTGGWKPQFGGVSRGGKQYMHVAVLLHCTMLHHLRSTANIEWGYFLHSVLCDSHKTTFLGMLSDKLWIWMTQKPERLTVGIKCSKWRTGIFIVICSRIVCVSGFSVSAVTVIALSYQDIPVLSYGSLIAS